MTAIPTEVVEAALDAMEKGNIDARQPYNEDDKRLMLAALTAAFPKLIENARKDAELLRRYHSWCEHNGCPPSASDLYNPDALSVPLPEIEGGDKRDGAETITESAGRRRTELAIAEYLKVRDESMGTPDADNAERLQSAKDIHSLVIRQQGTRTRLSERNAAMLAAPSASIEGETWRDGLGRVTPKPDHADAVLDDDQHKGSEP